MLVAVIVGAEVAFWLFIAAGLVARYLLGSKRTGGVLLAMSPAVDLVILTASIYDLKHGATAGLPHILSAVYLGVSVAWGHQMISWTDARFAHRFAGGPAPVGKPTDGPSRAVHELGQWRRHVLAWLVAVSLLGAGMLLVSDLDRTLMLAQAAGVWTIIVVVDTVISLSAVAMYRAQGREGTRDGERQKLLV